MIKQTHGCGNMIKTTLGCIVKTIEKVTDCVCAECRVLLHGQSQSKVKINPLSISAVLRCFRFISQVQPVRILEDDGVSLFMEKTKLCNEMTFKIRKDCFGVISVLLIFIPPALDDGNVDIPSTFTNNACHRDWFSNQTSFWQKPWAVATLGTLSLADLGGVQGCAPPSRLNFLYFHAVFGQI